MIESDLVGDYESGRHRRFADFRIEHQDRCHNRPVRRFHQLVPIWRWTWPSMIPGLLQNLANELNYRLALTLNSLVQITADSAVAVDSLVNIQLANGSYLTANNLRSAAQSLVSVNARPLVDGKFGGVIHPNMVRDILNDTSYNGLTDIMKRDPSMNAMLFELPKNEDVISFAGITFKQTSTAPTVTISGNTLVHTTCVAAA